MKKIIELVERYFELDQNPPCKDNSKESAEAREKWADTIWNIEQEIGDRIARRRELEATPITEDWLKEHGWENDYSVDECVADYTYVTFQGYIKKGDHYLLDWCNGVLKMVNDFNGAEFTKYDATVADLLDALELCGIKMED